jgi:hypothetical protein
MESYSKNLPTEIASRIIKRSIAFDEAMEKIRIEEIIRVLQEIAVISIDKNYING